MIVKQLKSYFNLDSQLKGWQHKVLSNFKVIVTYSEENQLRVYRIHTDNKLEYFEINTGIGEMVKCNNWGFILSKKENLILCKTEDSTNQLVLFTVDISKRSIINYKRLQVDGSMIWVQGCFQSQFYQLYKQTFYIYSYKKFPLMTKEVFRQYVRGFMTIYYDGIQYLKLKFTNAPDQFFKLPLRKESQQQLRYCLQQKNTLFTIKTRNPVKEQMFGFIKSVVLGVCRADDRNMFYLKDKNQNFKKAFYKSQFNPIRDLDNGMRIVQFRPKQKIIRKMPEAGRVDSLLNRFMIITEETQNQTFICDLATNRKSFLTDSLQVSVQGNQVLSLNNTEGRIYKLNYQLLTKRNSFTK